MPAAREPSLATSQNPRPKLSREDVSHANLILLALTLAGAGLRLWNLGGKSLWLDEGATVALARASWQHFTWVWWHGEASLQTIYFLLMRGWVHLGISEWWLRLPSAIFGIVSIPLLYGVALKFMHPAPALAAAAVLTFSPTHVIYSQEARSYTLTILIVLLSSYVFVDAVERGRRSDWVRWTVLGVLAFYSHDFAALVLVAQACSLLFKAKPAPWRRLILCGSIIFLCAIPGLTYVFRASPENLYFLWMPRPGPREIWHLAMFFGGSGGKIVLALILWVAGLTSILRVRKDAEIFWRGMFIVLWSAMPAAILALISLWHPMFLERYVIFSLPATMMLAAIGMSTLKQGRSGLILVIALCITSLPTILANYHKPREDWRGASNVILSTASPGDAVVFFPFYTRIMLDYYRDRYPGSPPSVHVYAPGYYAGGEDVRTLLDALNENPRSLQRVWVVVNGKGQIESFDHGTEARDKLQSIFGAPTVRRFPDVTVLQYGR